MKKIKEWVEFIGVVFTLVGSGALVLALVVVCNPIFWLIVIAYILATSL